MSDSPDMINWFPGHMAKARRILSEQVKKADLVIELCDARIPYSSRNPDLSKLCHDKRIILFLNKSDLANQEYTHKWIRYYQSLHVDAYAIDSLHIKRKDIIHHIESATKEIRDRFLAKGVNKTIKVIVAGVPNVGKSTFINQLHGKKIVQTGDRPGITKSDQWIHISPYLTILDTPGMLWPRLDDQTAAKRLCYIGSVKDDVVDTYWLTVSLLEDIQKSAPDVLENQLHAGSDLQGMELLESACKGRGWLLKGNRYDYDRACSIILDEFRAGKLGRFTFEDPDEYGGKND